MLGEHLQRLGHDVAVYAPELGPFADHARRRGVAVTDRVRELPETCDVVFSQDGIVVYDLAERFPDAFHAYRICGDVMDFQLPPQTADVVDLLVVLSDRYERIARAAAVRTPVLRLRVPIDIDRLVPLGPLRELSRLTAMQWSWELTAREFRTMHWPLREHAAQSEQRADAAERNAHAAVAERDAALDGLRRAEARAARAEEQAAALGGELAAVRATRAWRAASAAWRLRDALRRLTRR